MRRMLLSFLFALLLPLVLAPAPAAATSTSQGTCAAAFDHESGLPQICADIQGFPLGSGESFAYNRFVQGNVVEETFDQSDGVPTGISSTGQAYIGAVQNLLLSSHAVTLDNEDGFSVSTGAKNWTPIRYQRALSDTLGGGVVDSVLTQVTLDVKIFEVSAVSARYLAIDFDGSTAFDFDASLQVQGDTGSLSVVGSVLVNGFPIAFLQDCEPTFCTVDVDFLTSLPLAGGLFEIDAFLAAGGRQVDADETFTVSLTAPEGGVFTIVPEPGSLPLLGSALAVLGAWRRRRKSD